MAEKPLSENEIVQQSKYTDQKLLKNIGIENKPLYLDYRGKEEGNENFTWFELETFCLSEK